MRPLQLKNLDSAEAAQDARQAPQGSGTYFNIINVHIPWNPSSTGTAGMNWINPETGTIAAKACYYFTTAGTGTIDVGIGTNGTGTSVSYIDGGTLTVGFHYALDPAGATASSTLGGEDVEWQLLGPGTVTATNSIVAAHTDGVVSTAVGGMVIQYFPVGR